MKRKWWITAIVIFFSTSACDPFPTLPPPGPGPTQTHILDPQMNKVLYFAPYTLKFDSTAQMGIDSFEVSVNGAVVGSVPPLSSGSCGAGCGHSFYGEYVWTPPATGHFTISIRAFGNSQWGEPGAVEVTVIEDIAALASPPKLKPTVTPTAWFKAKVMVAVKQNSNCREGGGEDYRILAVLLKGEQAEAVARSEDGFYLQIIPEKKAEINCWIALELLEFLEGDVTRLPFAGFPPLAPEPEPTKPAGRP